MPTGSEVALGLAVGLVMALGSHLILVAARGLVRRFNGQIERYGP